MKKLFEKKSNKGLITAVVAGSIAAGVIAYLYLTDSGSHKRSNLKRKVKNKAKELASGAIANKTGISKKLVKKAANLVAK